MNSNQFQKKIKWNNQFKITRELKTNHITKKSENVYRRTQMKIHIKSYNDNDDDKNKNKTIYL